MMTREEEILLSLEDVNPREIASHIEHGTLHQWIKSWKAETRESIIAALRPVSREQVEKAWRGKWLAARESELTGFDYALAGCDPVIGYACSRCKTNAALDCNDDFVLDNFCPVCGAPMTDEAVQMVMERLERLRDE